MFSARGKSSSAEYGGGRRVFATGFSCDDEENEKPETYSPQWSRASSRCWRSPAPVLSDEPILKDQKAKSSYAVGVQMGSKLKGPSMDLDADLVSRGVKDAMTGAKTLLTEAEMKAALEAVRKDAQTKQVEASKERAEKNKKEGEAFLAENKAKEGVVTLESGLQYKVLKSGDGEKPAADDTVVCHYRGTLIDGTEFDSSIARHKPATLPLKRLIAGWSEALQLMPVGSRWQLFIPANLAYGEKGPVTKGPSQDRTERHAHLRGRADLHPGAGGDGRSGRGGKNQPAGFLQAGSSSPEWRVRRRALGFATHLYDHSGHGGSQSRRCGLEGWDQEDQRQMDAIRSRNGDGLAQRRRRGQDRREARRREQPANHLGRG